MKQERPIMQNRAGNANTDTESTRDAGPSLRYGPTGDTPSALAGRAGHEQL